jgi:3-hydroxyisobutyrate dehydrogenase-like beta-hydroxyacid dehydrogenase
MGRHMAANLQRAGHALQVYDLRPIHGVGESKQSVTDAAQNCELLFTSLPGPQEVEAVA